ncbi:MFS transporter [Actinomadura barringtoniae]|uniref:MFS transporter n=1 Tax=Actinomadura barringtoniae TaxID=1427535 RepID=A0A939PKI1_9ACTN|nr:MFS transporter [Actinomadura barringtoniae]MBO2450844.1 MFS transporter [Actinomadura barringtoniae]
MTLTTHQQPRTDTTPWARYAVLYAVLFFMGAETFLASPLLPSIAADVHASTNATARMVTGYVLAYAIAGPIFAALSNRLRRRTVIAGGIAVLIAGTLLCALAADLGLLITGQAIAGLGGAAAAPAMWAYLAERARADQRGRAAALGVTCYSLGQVLGVPAGALVTQWASWRWAYAAIGLALLVALAGVLLRIERDQTPPPRHTASPFSDLFGPWRSPQIRPALLATAFLQAGRLGAYTYVGVLYTRRFHFSPGGLALMGLVVGAGTLAGSLMAGILSDRWRAHGRNELALSSAWALLFSTSAAIALATTSLPTSLLALFGWFVAGGAFYATQQSYLGSADPTRRATVISWNNSLMHAGIAAGTTLLGLTALEGWAFPTLSAALGITASALALSALRLQPFGHEPSDVQVTGRPCRPRTDSPTFH